MSVILFLLPEAEVEGNEMISLKLQGFNWLLFQCTICNQLPVIKPSVSSVMHSVIGYYHEINLNISRSSLVVEVLCSR